MGWRDAIARAVLAGKTGGPHAGGIYTYHSSPYDFEKFDLSKLRSGEGANVYGAGFYSAESPKVSGQGGEYWQQFRSRFEGPENEATAYLQGANFDRAQAMQVIQEDIARIKQAAATRAANGYPDPSVANFWHPANEKYLQQYYDLLKSGQPIGPRTYELNLKVQPNELLDWLKPMAQQPEIMDRMQAAGFNAVQGNIPGGHYAPRSPEAAAEFAGAGIPGLRYLDQGSRNLNPSGVALIERDLAAAKAGGNTDLAATLQRELDQLRPTYNYVMFDPDKIDIMAKYGVAGGVPLGASIMGGTAAQDQYGAQQ